MFIVHWGGCYLKKDFDSVIFAVLFVSAEISGRADLVQACLVAPSQALDISYFNLHEYGYWKREGNNTEERKYTSVLASLL